LGKDQIEQGQRGRKKTPIEGLRRGELRRKIPLSGTKNRKANATEGCGPLTCVGTFLRWSDFGTNREPREIERGKKRPRTNERF